MIVLEVLPGLAKFHMDGILSFLPTPDLGNGITNSEEGSSRENAISIADHDSEETNEQGWEMWGEIHEKLDAALGDAQILDDVVKRSGYFLYALNHHGETFMALHGIGRPYASLLPLT